MTTTLGSIGPYRLVRRLAIGGMAEVFLAAHTSVEGFERPVVVKKIRDDLQHEPQAVTMFLDEARIGSSVSHPNLAQVLDLGRTDSGYYMVVEYICGPSLQQVIEACSAGTRRGLPLALAMAIAIGLCEGLHHLHTHRDALGRTSRIVHRDLSPSNVLISYEGAVKLIDLGVAKSSDGVYQTATGVIKGTFGYMAPEQVLGSKDIDHRADVFGLGLLLYEMTLGSHPFSLDTVDALLDMVRRGHFALPRTLVPHYPPKLERLVCRCLQLNPADRPSDIRNVQEGLEEVCLDLGVVPSMARIAEHLGQLYSARQKKAAGKVTVRPSRRRQRDSTELTSPDTVEKAMNVETGDDDQTQVYRWPRKP